MLLQGPMIIFVSFIVYSALHSVLAARRVKSWVRERFGGTGERYYRLIYNIIGVVTLLPILALLAIVPGQEIYRWSAPWLYMALLLQMLGAAVILIGLLQTGVLSFFGLSWLLNDSKPGAEKMITSGLYGWMRHPLYTGGLLMLWFMPLMTTSLLAFNLAATLYLYVGSVFEERRLLTSFGEKYAAYQARVPRFLPCPRRESHI
ncbi:MAG: isoprenylcysteine carboxylmethyltransferase family protein [Anaerolineales bacterium]|nr:isoprenylcysteine carboxylmethyltransferase family protein [Anaerolineales bacterium]